AQLPALLRRLDSQVGAGRTAPVGEASPMLTYVRNRLLLSLPVLVAVSIFVFLILRLLPGDPVQIMMGQSASAEAAEQLRRELGRAQPLHLQSVRFVSRALAGALGRSIRNNQRVTDLIWSQLPSTLQLTIAGLGFAVLLGVLFGTLAATHHRSWLDNAS